MSEKLVTSVSPKQFASYGQLQVAFYDKIYHGKPKLYIFIRNLDDKYSINDRAAGDRRVLNEELNYISVPETELFKRAYDKYLAAKLNNEIDHQSENELLLKRVAELEAAAASREASANSSAIVPSPKLRK